MKKRIILTALFILVAGISVYAYVYRRKDMAEPTEPDYEGFDNNNMTSVPKQRNFSISEFNCNDGSPVPVGYYGNVQLLMDNLQVLRDEIGVPIHVNSGYRTPAYNAKIGGAANSTHKRAMAADIKAPGYTAAGLHAKIEDLIASGMMKDGGLGLYSSFVHYDVRDYKARWRG